MEVTCLCFIEKSAGPVGTLAMLSDLVSKTGLPACIYREDYWSKRAKLSGYQPIPGKDKIAIVYDLIVTGHGVQQAANDIETKFGAKVAATVVLLSYDKEKRSTLEIGNGRAIRAESIGWYEDYVSEFERIRESNVAETEHVKMLEVIPTIGETECPPVSGEGTAVSPPSNGGKIMSRSTESVKSVVDMVIDIKAALGINVKQLAKALQVEHQTIYNWMNETETPHIQPRNYERLTKIRALSEHWNQLCKRPAGR